MPDSANFSNIYKFYDLINSVITLGFDKAWRLKARHYLIGNTVLDLGSGTGASYQQLSEYKVTALDPDKKMLELNKFSNKVVGHAENLPFKNETFDNVYSTFVWRNISNVEKSMNEIYRVLKPGGKFILLDMSRPKNKFLKIIHKIGTYKVLHIIGLLSFNLKEYRFLYKSLDKYPQPEIHLQQYHFEKLEIQRMGIFNFVYLAVFTK